MLRIRNCCMSKRILVLEDEVKILELMEMILEEEGHEVVAFNQYVPVDDVIEFGAQLIVLDIRLSNGYGHLLCKDLKANPSTSKIPVILVSGADNLATIAAECGADAYLQKPFGIEELIAIVSDTIKQSKIKRNPPA